MERSLSRRAWLSALAGGAGALSGACQSSGATEVTTPEGRVIQWEGDELIVLLSGVQQRYRPGAVVRLNVLVNNQSTKLVQVRLRTKLLGLGDQPVVQAEPVVLTVKPEEAASVDQELPTGRSLDPGDYTVSVEMPPWIVETRESGSGARLRAPVKVDAAG